MPSNVCEIFTIQPARCITEILKQSGHRFLLTRTADLPFVSIPKGETGSQRQAVKPEPARLCGRISINSPAWANRSPDRALSKQDSDQSTSETNPLVAKEKTNTVAESKADILSAHGQSMSGSEQRQ
jgi:hypothetical protein